MKARLFPLCLLLIAVNIAALSQSVVITPKKTVYRRPKPQYDWKRTFTVRRPIAKASTPALSKKITAEIDPFKVFDMKLSEELHEYQWLEDADYRVIFNRSGVLSIDLYIEGTGAYPSTATRHVVVDIKGGKRLSVPDVFTDLPGLAKMIRAAQLKEIAEATVEIKKDPDADPESLFAEADFKVGDLKEFTVTGNGVTFHYDYGFPHVLNALEPNGDLDLTYAQLKPFIRRDGLLARFVR